MFYCVDLTWFIAVISVFYWSVWACGVPHRASLGGTRRRTASAKWRRGQRSATDTAADVAGWTASSCTTTTTRLLVLHRSTDNAQDTRSSFNYCPTIATTVLFSASSRSFCFTVATTTREPLLDDILRDKL